MALVEDHNFFSSSTILQGVSSPSKNSSLDKADFKTFEEVYRSSYSHGLEAIYNIETVDLKTVRRIGEVSQEKKVSKQSCTTFEAVELEQQLEFDYGAGYREWMSSFVLQEPVQVLDLSRHAEKSLIELGFSNISDLIKEDFSKWVFMKGIGQGHIDEIQKKLSGYIEGRPLDRCPYIDFSSWLRSVLGSYSHKKVVVALEPFKLENLFALSPSESVEIRKLPLEKRLEWRHELDNELLAKRDNVLHDMGKVVDVFIKPWLLRRQGLATKDELIERLLRVSEASWMTHNALEFFSTLFFEGNFPLENYLAYADGTFFATVSHRQRYEQIVGTAMSYFYKDSMSYSLQELTSFLMREFAKSWKQFSPEFIKKTLRLSSEFRVRKAEKGILKVKLS